MSGHGPRAAALLHHPMLKGTAWVSTGYVGRLALQGVYFVLLARLLGAREFGVFAGGLALVSALAPFSGWGSGNILVMRVARDPSAFPSQFHQVLRRIAATGAVLIAISGLMAYTLFRGSSIQRVVLPLAFAEIIFTRVTDLAAQCFQAHDQLHLTARIFIGSSAVRLGAVLLFAELASSRDASTWALYYLSASAIAALGALTGVVRLLGAPRGGTRQPRDTWLTGFYFSLGVAAKTIYDDIDKVMLVQLATTSAAGIYTAADRMLGFAFAPVQAFVYSSNTRLFREGARGPASVQQLARRATPFLLLYGAVLAAAMWLLAPIVPLILGDSYVETSSALRWLSLLPLIQSIHYLYGDALMGAGKQGARSAWQVATALTNIGLNLWLVPVYTWRGAAVASLLCEAALAIALIVTLARLTRAAAGAGPPTRRATRDS